MSENAPSFRKAEFDPATVQIIAAAFEKARKSLHDRGQPQIVRDVITARMIAAVKAGERDSDRLCEIALEALGSKAVFER